MQNLIKIQLRSQSSPDNYYHYVRDFLVSIYSFLYEGKNTEQPNKIVIGSRFPQRFRKYSDITTFLFPKVRFEYVYAEELSSEVVFQIPHVSESEKSIVSNFSRYTIERVGASVNPNNVILIERSKQVRDPRIADGRPHVRFIKNHKHLREAVSNVCREKKLAFFNMMPENYTFQEQVEIFSRAGCVIGQHGAGLTNIFWMAPSTQVVEIQVSRKIPCYQQIANSRGLLYKSFVGTPEMLGDHCEMLLPHEIGRDEVAIVDVAKVIAFLEDAM